MKQQVPKVGLRWGPFYRGCISYFGGGTPTQDVEIRSEAMVRHGYVEMGSAHNGALQFRFQLHVDGGWKLLAADKAVAAGVVAGFQPSAWHALSFRFRGNGKSDPLLTCCIDGVELYSQATSEPPSPPHFVRVTPFIGSSYDPNLYKSVEIRYDGQPRGTETSL